MTVVKLYVICTNQFRLQKGRVQNNLRNKFLVLIQVFLFSFSVSLVLSCYPDVFGFVIYNAIPLYWHFLFLYA